MYALHYPEIDSQGVSDSLTSLVLTENLSDKYYHFKFKDKELRFREVKEFSPGSMFMKKKKKERKHRLESRIEYLIFYKL